MMELHEAHGTGSAFCAGPAQLLLVLSDPGLVYKRSSGAFGGRVSCNLIRAPLTAVPSRTFESSSSWDWPSSCCGDEEFWFESNKAGLVSVRLLGSRSSAGFRPSARSSVGFLPLLLWVWNLLPSGS